MKRSLLLLVLFASVVAGGAWLVRNEPRAAATLQQAQAWLPQLTGRPVTVATPSTPTTPPRPAPPVEVAPVEVARVQDDVEALGTLAANESVVIAPEIAGRVVKLGFREGDPVKDGQPLVELDPAILKTELQQAQSEFNLARDTYERARQLAQRGTGTQVALDQTAAALASGEARVASARARLEKATILAPFDGTVGLRTVGVGDYVAVGESLVTLTDLDPIKVDFRVPELLLSKVRDGQPIEVRLDALPDQTLKGEVYAIDPVVDVNGRAIQLRATIPNPKGTLKPGLFARVRVITDVRERSVVIPEAAVIPDATGSAVYVFEDGRVRLSRIVAGKRMAGKVEVTEGLKAGQQVVTAGQMRLRDGVAVAVTPETPPRKQAELSR